MIWVTCTAQRSVAGTAWHLATGRQAGSREALAEQGATAQGWTCPKATARELKGKDS